MEESASIVSPKEPISPVVSLKKFPATPKDSPKKAVSPATPPPAAPKDTKAETTEKAAKPETPTPSPAKKATKRPAAGGADVAPAKKVRCITDFFSKKGA